MFSLPLCAQDIQYSQFYAASLYLNPALTGSEENTRVGINYRNQWPGLEHSFQANSAYYDHFIEGRNSGVGFIVNGSRESLAQVNNIEIGELYSYRLRLGEYQFLNFGGQLSYVSRNTVFEDLVFGSQIDIDRGIVDGSVPYLPSRDSQHRYADLGFGTMWNSKNLWLGASAHHLTRPNLSYLDGGITGLRSSMDCMGGSRWTCPAVLSMITLTTPCRSGQCSLRLIIRTKILSIN